MTKGWWGRDRLGFHRYSHAAAYTQPISYAIGREPAAPFRHCIFCRKERGRKLLQPMENVLSFSPYGYFKEKCILPSCS